MVRELFSEEIVGTLDTLLMIADENAQEYRLRRLLRGGACGERGGTYVTVAAIEKQEWNAFKARLHNRKRFLAGESVDEDETADVDEDDVDMLLALVGVLDEHHGHPLTISEVVRGMQRERVVAVEFPATARAQTKRLLAQLRTMNRAWQDSQGRWSLL